MKVVALPEIQETSDLPCDTGSEIDILRQKFAHEPVDLGLVPKGWESKMGKWEATSTAIEARAREARVWLRGRTEEDVAVVTHGGFLHFLTEVGILCADELLCLLHPGDIHFPGMRWRGSKYQLLTWDT